MTAAPPRPLLPAADPATLGIDPARLAQMSALIERHIAEERYPGAQFAMARNGRLVALHTFGRSSTDPAQAATDDTLWLLFSQTKVIVAAAVWQLVDQGAVRFADRIADHVSGFEKNGKGEVTVLQVLTHQGGFPSATVGPEAWADHERLRQVVCDFTLDWTPGSKVAYHGLSAHWVAAVLIEAVTGRDFRQVIREDLLGPLGIEDVLVGVPEGQLARCADMHTAQEGTMAPNLDMRAEAWRTAGVPGGGGYATAAGMQAFYQMLLNGGTLGGRRVLSPRVCQYAIRNHTGDRVDENMGMPMHRGIGPHLRGLTPTIRGLGTLAAPNTFGHGGAGSSYSWADPDSGVSFTYLSNARADEPWHSVRLDQISNLAHAAIVEP